MAAFDAEALAADLNAIDLGALLVVQPEEAAAIVALLEGGAHANAAPAVPAAPAPAPAAANPAAPSGRRVRRPRRSPASVSPPPAGQQPPRPMNTFMIWSQESRSRVAAENPGLDNRGVTSLLGQMWRRDVTDEEKRQLTARMREIHRVFYEKYPHFVYHTKKRAPKGKKAAAQRRPAEQPIVVERLLGEAGPSTAPPPKRRRHQPPPPPQPAAAPQPQLIGAQSGRRTFRIERRPVVAQQPQQAVFAPPVPIVPQPIIPQPPPQPIPQPAPQPPSRPIPQPPLQPIPQPTPQPLPAPVPQPPLQPIIPLGVSVVYDDDDWFQENPHYVDENGQPVEIQPAAAPTPQPEPSHHHPPLLQQQPATTQPDRPPAEDKENQPPPQPAPFFVRKDRRTKKLTFDPATEAFLFPY